MIGLEPALQGPWSDTQVFSDLGMAPPTVGHQNSLAAVAQTAVGSSFEGGFELLAIVIVQGEVNHESILPAVVREDQRGDQTQRSAVCIDLRAVPSHVCYVPLSGELSSLLCGS